MDTPEKIYKYGYKQKRFIKIWDTPVKVYSFYGYPRKDL